MNTKEPVCEKNYNLDKSKCLCIKPIPEVKKRSRCPKGTRKHPTTGKCKSKETIAANKTIKKKHCPKGSHINLKTNRCNKTKPSAVKIPKRVMKPKTVKQPKAKLKLIESLVPEASLKTKKNPKKTTKKNPKKS